MTPPSIGWHKAEPPPEGHVFCPTIERRDTHLVWEGLDLAALFQEGQFGGLELPLPCPLEVAYLPRIQECVRTLVAHFGAARSELGYTGDFLYAYASKANTAEEIVRSTLRAGAHHEISSRVDVEIVRLLLQRGHLPADRWIIANGFKPPGSAYSESLLQLARDGARVLPIFDDLTELEPFLEAGVALDVGLRQKTHGLHKLSAKGAEKGLLDSRFGMTARDIAAAAQRVAASPYLRLRLHHAMLGSQMTAPADFARGLEPALQEWAALRKQHQTLTIFDFGGGIPARMTLDFDANYAEIARAIVSTAQTVARRHDVPEPDLLGEMGRYSTAEHAAHLFRVVAVKDNESPLPWYLIDGSIMTSFPDVWAIGEHFTLLPLNHLDRPFRPVRLGGITCDSDDVYPHRDSQAELLLPEIGGPEEELYLGFFFVGAYQEMLGGVRGSKHCVIPEAAELLLDHNDAGILEARLLPGHRTVDVLANLGYVPGHASSSRK